jgi:hypothetical protein
MSSQGRAQPLTSDARGHSRSATRPACVERLVTEVQRSFDPSILEGLVTSATDIQACQVTDSKQPEVHALGGSDQSFHARTIGTSSSRVVYCGVRRSCFMPHTRCGPAFPVAAGCTVPLP